MAKSDSGPAAATGELAGEPAGKPTGEQHEETAALLKRLQADPERGLAAAEAASRLASYGPNALEEKRQSPLLAFLGYFWGPIPWMIEAAAVLSALVGHWTDLGIILAMLLFNAGIGFWQEHRAANALDALRKQLALKARVLRDGQWSETAARALVPGDIVRLRLGDVVPADLRLLGEGYLSIDQAALTGESLPVGRKAGEEAYSGSVVKQGEMLGLVTATGSQTFFGRTASLVEQAGAASHFQKAVLSIGNYLIYITLALVSLLILVQLFRGTPFLELMQFALILTVAAIPIAMPAVLSFTMAVGALSLSRMKAIVSRLQAIEEMAGIDILCSDKTGTLTQNSLTLGEPVVFAAADAAELVTMAALASKAEDQDAIDLAVLAGVTDREALAAYRQTAFVPFDPVGKRTEATVAGPEGRSLTVTKGAPQVILELAGVAGETAERARRTIETLAGRGFRTLGVASREGEAGWRFLGILPLMDPPRLDSKETIAQAEAHGIDVKMVTGDNAAIACEIARQLNLGDRIEPARESLAELQGEGAAAAAAAERIERSDGFAEVFPEHKYAIVKALQERGHLVGMTGDGVNDAPALKQADVGIAVSGATDAARAAAGLVLTEPGLSVIVKAVEEARRIFERMNSYAIYRITETIRVMFFVVLAMLVFDFYPVTAIMIILLAFFNDVPIMAIATDNTWLDPKPVKWNMRRVLTVSTVLGLIGMVESFGFLWISMEVLGLGIAASQTMIFLKLAVAGHLTLFVARSRRPLWADPHPSGLLLWSALGTKLLATLFAVYGLGLITPITWGQAGITWAYCLVWMFVEDAAKLGVYRGLAHGQVHQRRFLRLLNRRLHHHA